jgi:membrane protein
MARLRQWASRLDDGRFDAQPPEQEPDPTASEWVRRKALAAGRTVLLVASHAGADRLPRMAAALSFQTLLSMVPVLVIALTLLSRFVSQREVSAIADWLSSHMLPLQAQAVAPTVRRLADAVDVGALSLAGVVGLLLMAGTLFWTLLHVADDIWQVRHPPSGTHRALASAGTLVLFPFLGGLMVYFSTVITQLPVIVDVFLPLTLTVGALWLAYQVLPTAQVRAGPPLVAALATGVLFEGGRLGFGVYVGSLAMTVRGLYGAIAVIPLSLLWLYLWWLLFLLGLELTYVLQNGPSLWYAFMADDEGSISKRWSKIL